VRVFFDGLGLRALEEQRVGTRILHEEH
jgi:hypothetical protein